MKVLHKVVRDLSQIIAQLLIIRDDLVVIDTETTGLATDDEIVEVAAVNLKGDALLDTYVRPRRLTSPNNRSIQRAPTFDQVMSQHSSLRDPTRSTIAIYNADYDLRLMDQSSTSDRFWQDRGNTHCVMRLYADFWGDWDKDRGLYTPQSLEDAADQCGLQWEGEPHQALADAQMALNILKHMARSE